MKYLMIPFFCALGNIFLAGQSTDMIVRISEITVDSAYLKEYNRILLTEARASVQKEPGVISIFPMYQKDSPNQIRILEVYTNRNAYENHIKSPHFLEYKLSTIKMVKTLKLIDMHTIDTATMAEIFKKL